MGICLALELRDQPLCKLINHAFIFEQSSCSFKQLWITDPVIQVEPHAFITPQQKMETYNLKLQ